MSQHPVSHMSSGPNMRQRRSGSKVAAEPRLAGGNQIQFSSSTTIYPFYDCSASSLNYQVSLDADLMGFPLFYDCRLKIKWHQNYE